MRKTNKNIIILLSVIITCILSLYFHYSYTNIFQLLQKESSDVFREAIQLEQRKRIIDNNFVYYLSSEDETDIPTSYTIETEDFREEIKKTEEELKETYTERINKGLETALYLESLFPNIVALDSIFKSMLDDLNYPFLTATKYVDNLGNREIFSNTDSVFYIKADTVSPFTAGIRKEITFKGYMKIPRWFIFKQMSVSFTVLGLIWLICMGIFAFLLFRKNPVVEKKKREGLIPITDDISFDKERKCLVGPNKKASLTKQQVQFFDLVLKDPERYAYYEEMRVVLWEGMVFSQDNMTQMISRARKNIRIFPELEIKNIPGTGYQLYIRTEEEVKEFLAKQTKNEEKESA